MDLGLSLKAYILRTYGKIASTDIHFLPFRFQRKILAPQFQVFDHTSITQYDDLIKLPCPSSISHSGIFFLFQSSFTKLTKVRFHQHLKNPLRSLYSLSITIPTGRDGSFINQNEQLVQRFIKSPRIIPHSALICSLSYCSVSFCLCADLP